MSRISWPFAKQLLSPGDVVEIITPRYALGPVRAAVLLVASGVLQVLSPALAAARHDGRFVATDIEQLRVVSRAIHAIGQEAPGLHYNQFVELQVEGHRQYGRVIAACGGLVAVMPADQQSVRYGHLFTCHAAYLRPVERPHLEGPGLL